MGFRFFPKTTVMFPVLAFPKKYPKQLNHSMDINRFGDNPDFFFMEEKVKRLLLDRRGLKSTGKGLGTSRQMSYKCFS